MHTLINYNGKVVAAQNIHINPANAGLLHGFGVFTTLRIYNGHPFLYKEHYQRLSSNAKAIGLMENWTYEVVHDALMATIKANKVVEGKCRITLVQNKSLFWSLSAPQEEKPMLLIFTGNLSMPKHDLSLTISPYRINSTLPFSGIKVIGYLQQIMTLKEAKTRGFDEAIVLNERGEICEAASSNIFWVKGGVLYTPTISTGCLPGIARNLVLDLAHKNRIEVTEGAYHSEQILTADEVFLTSSLREMMRVNTINFHQIPSAPHSIFEKLFRAYKNFVYVDTHQPHLEI